MFIILCIIIILLYYLTYSCFVFYSEILRVIDSLQLTDRLKVVATPANWVVCLIVILTLSLYFDKPNSCLFDVY